VCVDVWRVSVVVNEYVRVCVCVCVCICVARRACLSVSGVVYHVCQLQLENVCHGGSKCVWVCFPTFF